MNLTEHKALLHTLEESMEMLARYRSVLDSNCEWFAMLDTPSEDIVIPMPKAEGVQLLRKAVAVLETETAELTRKLGIDLESTHNETY
jgi:hypothetical protein